MKNFNSHKKMKYAVLLVIQIIFWALVIVFREHRCIHGLMTSTVAVMFGVVAIWLSPKRFIKVAAVVSGLVAVAGTFAWTLPGITALEASEAMAIAAFCFSLFILATIVSVGYNVFITDEVSADQIVGGICIYILLATFFACLFAGVGLLLPGSLVFTYEGDRSPMFFAQYMYYSVMILTTTGLGDIIPTHPFTRFLTSLEELIGPIYLAIMMARLVGLHISQKHLRQSDKS